MPLGDYERDTFTHEGKARQVFRRGEGPAVIVIAEVPGITPAVLAFADRVAGIGCTAVLPHLFGEPGAAPSVRNGLGAIGFACVSREFTLWATGRTSPVTVWLRALARHEHERCGGPGVGAVGMCLTGGFALAMMVDDVVAAPVLSQPSLPLPVLARQKRDLGISAADLARVKERGAAGVTLLGLRFTCDRFVPAERFARLRDELGDAFVGVEIDSSPGNPHGIGKMAHSVLTEELVDEPGHPTRDALDQVLELFRTRLLVGTAPGG
ncbi:MAG TPA: dienelactone hydrolase family protein [Acidimicrobiales bacterium]|nr:dienelactone hydrolase family protein [Acidimicrobiales bacterium]